MANKTYLDKSGLTYFWGKIKNLVNSNITPVGSIQMFGGTTAPSGWLICDGSEVSRTTYADLFNVIGTTYGTGDGSNTFNLPNFKGRVPVGLDGNDTDFNTLGKTGGSKELQAHKHQAIWGAKYMANDRTSHTYGGVGFCANSGVEQGCAYYETSSTGTGNSGNLQPYIILNYIIKYQ